MIMRVALVCVALIVMSPASVPAEEKMAAEELPGQPGATNLHGGALREVKRLLGAVGSWWLRGKRETEEVNSTESIPSYLTHSIDSISALQKAMAQQIVDYLEDKD
ncbi:uncharacterized protein LOC144942937 [Lampetra fluviatilis]